jgi:PRTRC genetic system protein C
MLMVKNVVREFKVKRNNAKDDVVLPDPNPNMEPIDVMKFYSGQCPELTSASVNGPNMKNGKAIYLFETVIGEKG